MPVFKVRRRIDAFVDYVAEIDAATPEEAARSAKENSAQLRWAFEGVREYDAESFVALDRHDGEIESSACGDFD